MNTIWIKVNTIWGERMEVLDNKRGIAQEIITKDVRNVSTLYLKMYNIIKRAFDIVMVLIAMILLLPVFIIIAIMIKVDSKGPVFYVQKRIGLNGKLFKMYKFRTMVVGADKKLRTYLMEQPEASKEYKKYKKLAQDPRITKVGRFLRKTSLDELPQLINILKGEMSIVGPRPFLLKEKKDMGIYYDSIIKCKPGLTCIWQVSGRSKLSFEERLKLDIEYIEKRNIRLDLKLIIMTFFKTLKNEGAV